MTDVCDVELVHRLPDRYRVVLWDASQHDDGIALVELKWLNDDVGGALICRFHNCYISLHSKSAPLCGCLREVMRWRAQAFGTENRDDD
jgi:hypothetical protein